MNRIPSNFESNEFVGCALDGLCLFAHHVEMRFSKHPSQSIDLAGKAPRITLEAGFWLNDGSGVRLVEADYKNIGKLGGQLAQLIGSIVTGINKIDLERVELKFSSAHTLTTEVFDGGESYHLVTSK